MIPKETKYNLHYGKVRGDVLPPPHGTNTKQCSKINVKTIAFGNKEHTTDKKMGVSVLLRLFISSNEVCNTPSSVYMSSSIFKDSTMGPLIPKEMKYNLHYGKVRGDNNRLPWSFGLKILASSYLK